MSIMMTKTNILFILLTLSVSIYRAQSTATSINFYEDSALCKVYEIRGINTPRSEYSPVFYKFHLLYVGAQKKKPLRLFSSYKKEPYTLIYSSEKEDSAGYFNEKIFNQHIQNKYLNSTFCFTPDDSTLYFTRSASVKDTKKSGKKGPALKQQIFFTAMNTYGLAHEEIKPFLYNSFEYDCMHPSISKNGKKLYFTSNMPGSLGGTDIWICEWKDGAWDKPKNAGPNINTEGNESYPFIGSDNILYFASDKRPGLGGLDIFAAEPTIDGNSFIEAENVGNPMNTQFDDFGIFFIDEGKTGYLTSSRKDNDNDLYYLRNNKPRSFPAKIRFVDAFTSAPVPVTLSLSLPTGVSEAAVDSGKFYTTRLRPGKGINLTAVANKYFPTSIMQTVETKDTVITVEMRPKSRKCIEGKIVDKDNNLPLSGVKVAIYDEEGNKYLDHITDSSGNYSICNLPLDKALYIGSQKKPDYFSNTDKFFIPKDEDLKKDIYAMKIVVGKAIKIDNIYFDKGKFNVRPDAALELDKLVKLMKDNPEVIIELSSHTDCNGAAGANLTLSDKRAKSSAAYIASKGVDSKRIKGKGYGESKLVNDCKCEGKQQSSCSEEQHAQNRRVEIKVTGFVAEKTIAPVKGKGKKK